MSRLAWHSADRWRVCLDCELMQWSSKAQDLHGSRIPISLQIWRRRVVFVRRIVGSLAGRKRQLGQNLLDPDHDPECLGRTSTRPNARDPDGYELWLDPAMQNVEAMSDLLKPFDARLMRCYRNH